MVRTMQMLTDPMGRSESKMQGPLPGDGAVVHECSGEADFDGLPGDALPPRKDAEKAKPCPPGDAENNKRNTQKEPGDGR